jgi:sterol desaturase/sphingolipid hydroxylase (fatty acid hydroxylase superfamily)
LVPVFAVSAALSFIFPVYTVPMLVAGIWQFYCVEEWVHHSVHYYNFRDPYFRYMKKHHFYHHTSNGMTRGFGLTSGIWDRIVGTAFSKAVRERLYGRRQAPAIKQAERSIPQT